MGTAPAAPSLRPPSRMEESPASPSWATRLIALVATWLVLGLATFTAPPIFPSVIWTSVTTRARHRLV
jgi:hypothetical protein